MPFGELKSQVFHFDQEWFGSGCLMKQNLTKCKAIFDYFMYCITAKNMGLISNERMAPFCIRIDKAEKVNVAMLHFPIYITETTR